jgi:iron-sulfur cluster repair protein YtfE (RIC family)
MRSTEHWLVHEHTQFEELLRQCKDAADISDWWALEQFFLKLVEHLQFHMAQEEEVLFPAYEAKSASSPMSTSELRNEHSVIIESFRELARLIKSRQSKVTYDCIVALELLMLEHNEKEEFVFLPYASHLLYEDRDELLLKLDKFVVSNKSRNWNLPE